MTKPDDLIAYLFEGQQRSETVQLSRELRQWMEDSTRFTAFVEIYRDKIRKKIRLARDPESLLDARGELEVARGLLGDRRLEVAYEPYASAKRRGPDFSVTYRDNLTFNIEVARIRAEAEQEALDLARKEERILRILLDKLGQMQPGMPNLLVIHTLDALARSIGLETLMRSVKIRAEAKDPAFYAASRYNTPAEFYKDFLRLSGILLWSAEGPLWINKQARPPLPEKVLRLLSTLAASGR